MSMVIGMFIGLIGGYLLLYGELCKYAKDCGYRCDKCKCNYCIAKKCWITYSNLHRGDKK